MYDIITIGSATRDVFMTSRALHPHRAPDAVTHIEACFPFGAKVGIDEIFFTTGGGATNTAATFSRLGKMHSASLCRIADDSAGKEVLEALRKEQVGTEFIQIVDGHAHGEHTAYSTILSPGGEVGERTILVYRGASAKIEHNKISWRKLQAKWFYVSSLGGDLVLLKKILQHAKEIGAQVAFNPGGQEIRVIASEAKQSRDSRDRHGRLRSLAMTALDFLILNREEAAKLTGKKFSDTKGLLRALSDFAPTTLMTDGPKGAYAITRNYELPRRKAFGFLRGRRVTSYELRAYHVPSVGHKPKNLTGAGDAFGAGFVVGWIKSKGDIVEALRVASFNADSVVQQTGAKLGILRSYPSEKQLNSLSVKKLKMI